jgi:hypothetical protein
MKNVALVGSLFVLLLDSGCLWIVAGTAAAKAAEPGSVHKMFVPVGPAFAARDRTDQTLAPAAELEAKGYARIGFALVTYSDGDRGDAVNLLRDTAEAHGGEVFQVVRVDEGNGGWFGFGAVWRKAPARARACDPIDLAGCTVRAADDKDADAALAAYADACADKYAPACDKLRAYAASSATATR